MAKQVVRTTVAVAAELLREVDKAVDAGKAKNRNEFIARALQHELQVLRKAEIDNAFAAMSEDRDFQELSRELSEEFADSDWEALRRAEQSS